VSGLNFKKKGLKEVISIIITSQIDTIYLTHKDRLLRFGSDLVINIAKKFGTKVICLSEKTQSFEEQLATDVLEIITVCSARLYGSRLTFNGFFYIILNNNILNKEGSCLK
jgi:predicted site-specific integrase-resolvase